MKYKKYQQEFIHFVDIVCQNTVHVINQYFEHFSEIIPIHKNVYYETKTSLNKSKYINLVCEHMASSIFRQKCTPSTRS